MAAVVEEGSFRGAGTKLGLSPSVVSHHISNLEEWLDCAILYRTSRKLKLTQKGAVLHKAAREMVDAVSDGLTAITEKGGQPCGSLRIAAPQVMSGGAFMRTIEEFMSMHPKVQVELTFTAEAVHPLNDGFDFVFASQRPQENAVESRQLTQTIVGFYAAPDLARKIEKIALSDVPYLIPLILSPGFEESDWVRAFSDATGSEFGDIGFRMRCNDMSVAFGFCAAGNGISVLPTRRISSDLQSGRLVNVLPELPLPQLRLYALWPRAARKTSLTRRFLEHILAELDGQKIPGELQVAE